MEERPENPWSDGLYDAFLNYQPAFSRASTS